MSLSRYHRLVFGTAVLVYLVTAWNSTGYHSADEHFQIVAFAQWKLGELPVTHLAWEFNAGIRSSFQPWTAVCVFKGAELFGVDDPFLRTFLLRLITAGLALFAMHQFIRTTVIAYDEQQQRVYIALAYGLWFLPFLAARFSSEGWAAIFLLLSVTSILRGTEQRGSALQAGLYLGIAMLCRPPTGLIVLSGLAWMVLIRRDRPRIVLTMAGLSLAILALGAVLDTLFYGRSIPTTWNYIVLGVIGDPLIQFDHFPWYYYAPWIIKYAIPPIGALILIAFTLLLIKRPTHILVWCMLPYVIAHSFIAHKELRFLYPLAPFIPWMLMEAWKACSSMTVRIPRIMIHVTLLLLLVANILGLSVVMTEPAGEGRVRLAEELHRVARAEDRIGYAVDPPKAWRIMLPDFYRPENTDEAVVPPHVRCDQPERLAYIVVQDGAPQPITDPAYTVKELARTSSAWGTQLMRWYTWEEGQRPWTLYSVQRTMP